MVRRQLLTSCAIVCVSLSLVFNVPYMFKTELLVFFRQLYMNLLPMGNPSILIPSVVSLLFVNPLRH